MTKPVIVTRAGKGSALTWTEGDSNLTNLRDATITVTDGTNSKAIDLNGTITFTAGTNVTLSVNTSTGAVTINSSQSSVTDATNAANIGIASTDGNASDTTMSVVLVGAATATNQAPHIDAGLTYNASTNTLTATTFSGSLSGSATSATDATNATNIAITNTSASASANYLVFVDSTSGNNGAKVTSTKLTFVPSTGILTATGFSGPINGTIGATTANTGAFTTLSASSTVSGTGFSTYLASPPAIGGTSAAAGSFTTLSSSTSSSLKAITEGALYDLGTTGGTIAPNVANGNVQKITLNSALTLNAFTSPVAGQTLTLIIYGGTAYTSITSTMKFAGGIKTLTGTAGCIDILSVYYDGTNYFASLGKGFA